jgi:1-acyl-sn-glycerol-3-phosphate acyltransferase
MHYVLAVIIWIYGSIVFLTVILAVTLLAILLPPRIYNSTAQALMRFLVRAFGGRVVVEGLENFDHKATYLFMPNHVSMFDVPMVGGFIPNYARGVEAAHHFKWPIFGWFVSRIGNIPIQRDSAYASMRSFKRAAEEFERGKSIIIMPEGTRTRTGQMRPFKKLPFHLAKTIKADIVPMGMSGLFRFKPKTSWIVRPGPIKVKFGVPVKYEETEDLTVEELRDLVREKIAELVEF